MTKTIPNVGDTIYATFVQGVPHAEKRLCTVTSLEYVQDGKPDGYVRADFPAYTDSDGIDRHARGWNVSDWIAKGDTVKATDIPGYSHLDGSVVTVTDIRTERSGRIYFEASGFKDARFPDAPMDLAFYGAEKCEPLPDPEATILKSDHDKEVERLKAELSRAQERLGQQQSHYRHDMQHIEDVMRRVKEEQGWCDEGTNDVIERVNDGLTGGWEFDRYEQEFEFYVNVTGTLTKRVAVTVSAVNEDAAREMLEEDPESFLGDDTDTILTDAARNVSFTDVEVEVD